jgi:hypothetical protein
MPVYVRRGAELSVNTSGAWIQDFSRVATFADGGFVVVWTTFDAAADGSVGSIKAQRFDSAGNKTGGEFLVNSSFTSLQSLPAVTSFADGSFAVAWTTSDTLQDGSGKAIKARLFGASGSPAGPEFLVNTIVAGDQTAPNIVTLSNGNFLVSWDDSGSTDVFARLYAANGAALGPDFRLNTNLTGNQNSNDVIALAGGGFVAVWRTTDTIQDGSNESVKGQLFDSTGAKVGGEFLVNSVVQGPQNDPSITALTGGGFVVTWMGGDTDDGHSNAIKAQVFSASGTKLGAEFLVNTFGAEAQMEPVVTAAADGGFMIAWITLDTSQDGNGLALKAQLFNAAGGRVGTEFLVNTQVNGNQSVADMATLSDGRVIVTWTDTYADGPANWGIKAQIFAADTTPPSPVNRAPVFTSDGGGATGSRILNENVARATTLIAADPDGEPVTYAIVGGADAGLFTIGAQTGRLTFVYTPDFEAPGDSNRDNVYDVIVSANDGSLTGTQALSIRIADVNEPITFTSVNNYILPEGYSGSFTISAHDPENPSATMSYRISGGPDSALFAIDPVTGALAFRSAPDFEAPADAGRDNRYDVTVEASDGVTAATQAIMFTIYNINDTPVIGSNGGGATAALTVAENQTAVTTVTATDGDSASLVYSIVGGADRTRFAINASTGVLAFVSPPNFEARVDSGGNNVYDVTVSVSDGSSSDTQALAITVANVNEGVTISGSQTDYFHMETQTAVATFTASDPDGTAVTWSIAGGADAARFVIGPASGALRFASAPDFEAPSDSNRDNVYQLVVRVSDGEMFDLRTISVTVTDVNEPVTITSGGGGSTATFWVRENSALATTVTAVDVENAPIIYSIGGGVDSSLFAIDAATGALSFIAPPDYEHPADRDRNNAYEVLVRASDGQRSDTQLITINVSDYHDAPIITSDGGDLWADVDVDEGTNVVTTVVGWDEDGYPNPVSYSITGGIDSPFFSIDAATGVLSFIRAPDFENPSDWGADGVYAVTVTASDGVESDDQYISVHVRNVDEGVTFLEHAPVFAVEENLIWAGVFSAISESGEPIAYSITGGADAALFAIDAATGDLSFVGTPDFEAPGDWDGDNVYELAVTADDGHAGATQSATVIVFNRDEDIRLTSYAGAGSVALTLSENAFSAGQVAASDPEGDTTHYYVSGGADADLFTIGLFTGELTFIGAPDFEVPADADGDNVYDVRVSASSETSEAFQYFSIHISNANEGIAITSGGGGATAAYAMEEGTTAVTVATSADPDGTAATYSIAGGADASLFAIDSATGALRFVAAPDFEAPADAGGDNVYEVVVAASDGEASDSQAVSVTVGNVDEPIRIVSYGGAATIAVTSIEDSFATGVVVEARDDDGSAVTYSITGGADAESFEIDPVTGALSFMEPNAPDFEDPTSVDGDNVHEVVVTASSPTSSATQAFLISITNRNEAPYFYYDSSLTVNEGVQAITTLFGRDRDGDSTTLAIVGGADAALFELDSVTNLLTFIQARDFEAPLSAAGTNVYDVEIESSDGQLTTRATLQITIRNVNEAVAITSGGGGDTAAITVVENGTAVTTVAASDVDGDALTYSITGGADGWRFAIDARTGALRFVQAQNFEDPWDAGADHVYDVVVSVTDGALTDSQAIAVTVANLTETVTITSGGGGDSASIAVAENSTAVTTVAASAPGGDAMTYAIAGGADAARFTISATTGALAFVAAPNFEAPADAGADNVYDVVVSATNGDTVDTQALAVTVGNVNEQMIITSDGGGATAAVSVNENSIVVTTVVGSDPDGAPVTYVILHGGDSGLFTINSTTGVLSFRAAPNFEAPGDSDRDNVYTLKVSASDGLWFDDQTITVTVANVVETVAITSNGGGDSAAVAVPENGTAVTSVAASASGGDAMTYAISGGVDAARFTVNASTGLLAFVSAPNFEAPADAGADNVYDVIVSATNGETVDTQAIAVTVGNVNESIAITSDGAGAGAAITVSENNKLVTTVVGVDVDGDPVGYLLIGGADFARFTIDSTTGILTFKVSPDFEAPGDSGADNVYEVIVWASDGHYTDYQTIAVTVANVLEPVVITSNGGGAGGSVAVTENGTAVATVAAINPDGGPLTYAIAGGADAARFTIDASTGVLAFVAAPNFEAPADAEANNVYDVVVSAGNGISSDTQSLAVTVGNVNEPVTITSNGGGSTASVARAENGTAVAVVAAGDPDGGAVTYAIAGGADASRFTIDAATGALAFIAAPNFEAPADAGGNNVYDVVVSASDGSFVDTQAIAVTVGNVAEAPVITSSGGGAAGTASVAENSLAVVTVGATDPDGTAPTYSIVGGADAARFTINPLTGALQFVAAPDWELPSDSNQDNVYAVIVRAGDGQLFDDQVLNVTVTNIRDGNTVTGTSSADSISDTSTNSALRTSNEEDLVFGRGGHDTIQGMAGDDEIYGEDGNDTLVGGGGADKLYGGLGKDVFAYNNASESTGASRDLIMDFSRSQGDKISLSAIDANSLLSNNQAFTFIGTSAFSNVAGQLRYETAAGVTTIFGDVNGDGVADLQIQLSGSVPLIASDFVL